MTKYKAIVKYKVGITDHMEFESAATNPKDIQRELAEKINEDVSGNASDFFNTDDVSIEYEITDIAVSND